MYDTLPLDAVVGRCLALESSIYCLGRPKLPHYEEVVGLSQIIFYGLII